MQQRIVVIYHANCPDGFGGAWAAWKKFGAKARYVAASHNADPLPLKGREIYLVDFMYPPKATARLVRDNERVVAIDHHVSSELAMAKLREKSFSIENSGSVLAWRYFHPRRAVPRLLQYIEDRDLWKFRLPQSEEIGACIDLAPQDFSAWDKLAAKIEKASGRKEAVSQGSIIIARQNQIIRDIAKNARLVKFVGREIYAVNSPVFESELGHLLSARKPPIAIVWSEREGKIKVSLRSDGTADVSKIAEKYGGGGHKAAAGFSLPTKKRLPWE